MDMALLIVERSAVFASIIPVISDEENYEDKLSILNCMFVMFNNFIIKMKENKSPTLTLPEYPDLLLVVNYIFKSFYKIFHWIPLF